jgi:ribosomal-protein-alanine N-acetyltransferase
MLDGAIRIRVASPADLPDLCEIERACFALPWSEESLRHDLEDHPEARYLAACSPEGTLIGYAAYWQAINEGMITNIAVTPAWQGRGIGRRLLASLISLAMDENLDSMVLEVRSGNLAARRMYESAGFSAVGLRHGYYEDNGEDAIIMLKKLV